MGAVNNKDVLELMSIVTRCIVTAEDEGAKLRAENEKLRAENGKLSRELDIRRGISPYASLRAYGAEAKTNDAALSRGELHGGLIDAYFAKKDEK